MNLEELPADSPLKRFFNAALRAAPRQITELVQGLPEVSITVVINGVSVPAHSILQILFAEDTAKDVRFAELERAELLLHALQNVPPCAVPVPTVSPAEQAAIDGVVLSLSPALAAAFSLGAQQTPVTIGSYVIVGTQEYARIAALVAEVVRAQSKVVERLQEAETAVNAEIVNALACYETANTSYVSLHPLIEQLQAALEGRVHL